jgi:predicted metal-dependent phosphoesterase TrpH
MRIDLHAHSSASDGTDSPAELLRAAVGVGLDVVALTDHDTTSGWPEALAACPPGLTVVPGVEFSCVHVRPDGRRVSLHLLGYLCDPGSAALQGEWARLRESRRTRGRRMVESLAADGYPISWAQVSRLAPSGSVGRPHIGRALVEAGVVPDVDTAFRELLSWRQKYYIRKADTDVFTALRLLRDAGGLPVFAHPRATRRGPVVDDEVVAEMAAAGLIGLEVDHPDQGPDDRAHAARLAAELGLLPLGSSDYHGRNKTTPLGACVTAPDVYERLVSLPAATAPVRG